MNCPFCDSNLNKVVDKRGVEGRGEIRRRRECLKCGKRFTTHEEVKKSGNDILQEALKGAKTEHFNFQERVDWNVSTGSLLLDIATGGLRPGILRLAGAFGCGKTPQMLENVRNILTSVPNSKALWVIAEGRGLSDEHIARCGLTFVYKAEEWKVGTVFIL